MTVTITDPGHALAIIQKTQEHGAFKGEVPTDPGQLVAKGQEVYLMALQARATGMTGPPVDDPIAIAEGGAVAQAPQGVPAAPPMAAPPGFPPPAAAAPVAAPPAGSNPFQQAAQGVPVAPPAAAAPPMPVPPAPAPVPTPAPLPEPEMVKIRQVATGAEYEVDPSVVDQYISSPEYELVQAQVAAPAAAPPPAAFPPQGVPQPQAAEVPQAAPAAAPEGEPWPGYSGENIGPIMDRVTKVFTEQPADIAKQALFTVWEYETANKNRATLLKKLKELGENGVQTQPPQAQLPVPGEGADVQPQPPFQPPAGGLPAPTQFPQPGVPVPAAAPPAAAPPAAVVPPSNIQVAADPGNGLVAPLQGTTQKSEAAIRAENLPIPQDIQGEAIVLPQDFTQIQDGQLGQYASYYHGYLARANWLAAIAEGHAADAKIVADGAVRAYKAANPAGKGVTVDQIEAQAFSMDQNIQYARQVQFEYGEHAKKLRELGGIYEAGLVRLSREQTRRSDERNVAG